MADNQVLADVSGLQVSNNTFSASPPGSLRAADECVMPQKGVIEPRRGQARLSGLPSSTEIPFAITEFGGAPISNNSVNRIASPYTLSIGSSAFSGTYDPVDLDLSGGTATRMKFAQASGFLYFCTTTGAKCLESTISTPRAAGLLRMPDAITTMASASGLVSGGAGLPYGQSRAYRTVLRKPLTDGTSLLSPPSGRAVVRNELVAPAGAMVRTGGTTVTVTFPLDPSASLGLSPGDTFELTPGEADFPSGSYTVATVTGNVVTYTDAGSDVANTDAQSFDTGPRPVGVVVALSGDATTSTPVRIYRSYDTEADAPGDEMFLVAEVFPSSTNITNGFLVYLDVTPESVINDPLYTNPQTGEGASQSNDAPPIYRDLAWWGSRMWFLNTTNLQTFRLQLLGVGAPDGVQNDDTITIFGTTFTFKDSPSTPGHVPIVSTGTPSYNIEQTTQNLVEEIFELFRPSAGNVPIRAYYNSAQNEAPGKLLLQAISYAQAAFGITASRPASWAPALSASAAQFSTAERRPNGLDYSKLGQPEAVPTINRTAIGSANYPAVRILALQNALLIFKRGDGIWAVTGEPPFQVQQISVANIISADAACVFADAAWAYTDQGILRISEAGGATVVSRPIETELNRLLALFPDETRDYSFAVPYETERRVMFFVPVGTTLPNHAGFPILQAYAYCVASQAWTGPLYIGTDNPFCGVVSRTQNKLLLGIRDTAWGVTRLTLERKGNSPAHDDYADASFTATITDSTTDNAGNRVIRFADATDIEVGDGITQGNYRTKLKAERTDLGARWFETWERMPFTAAACSIFKHYDVKVAFQPFGHPTARKTLTRLSFLFKPEWYAALDGSALVMTDQIQAELKVSAPFRGFGLTPFGQGPFGNPTPLVVDVNPIDAKWANAAQFFVGFSLSEAWPRFKLQGFSATLLTQDAPVGRGR